MEFKDTPCMEKRVVMSNARWLAVGMVVFAFVLLLLLSSCRSVPVSPVSGQLTELSTSQPESPSAGPAISEVELTPAVVGLRASVRDGILHLSGTIRPQRLAYDPEHAGGWMLQLFLNTDQAETGYPWMGVDYVVRGSERSAGGEEMTVRRIEPGFGDPGGWGPQSGVAQFTQRGSMFVLQVPMAALGGDDGVMDFVLETYTTVNCAKCEGGVTHYRLADYSGVTRIQRGMQIVAASGSEVVMLPGGVHRGRLAVSASGSGTDASW